MQCVRVFVCAAAAATHFISCVCSLMPLCSLPLLRRAVFYAIVIIMGSLHHYNVRLSGQLLQAKPLALSLQRLQPDPL